MPNVVGVRFKKVDKIYFFAPPKDDDIVVQDPVVVETARGTELGWVVKPEHEVSKSALKGSLKPVLRKANPLDLMDMEAYKMKEPEALEKCKRKVEDLNLPMKMIRAEYSFNGAKLTFYFTAEQRVDFRDLVRYLVRAFRTRVEMRQIGARDEAKMIDGYGRCGRQLCCSSWLTEFHPVSIRMAKNQQLPLAPTEISGLCGKLLCCLAYENDFYTEMRKEMPKVGTKVTTVQGDGVIRGLNLLKQRVVVKYFDDGTATEEIDIEYIAPLGGTPKAPPPEPIVDPYDILPGEKITATIPDEPQPKQTAGKNESNKRSGQNRGRRKGGRRSNKKSGNKKTSAGNTEGKQPSEGKKKKRNRPRRRKQS